MPESLDNANRFGGRSHVMANREAAQPTAHTADCAQDGPWKLSRRGVRSFQSYVESIQIFSLTQLTLAIAWAAPWGRRKVPGCSRGLNDSALVGIALVQRNQLGVVGQHEHAALGHHRRDEDGVAQSLLRHDTAAHGIDAGQCALG